MEPRELQFIETAAVIIFLILAKIILRKIITGITRKFNFPHERKQLVSSIFNLFIFIFAVVAITAIWSVDPKQFLVFLTSILTVIGIAFFAQWSILSNVTSTVILVFTHPLKIGGNIKILDKDFPIEGKVEKISFFFLYIRTANNAMLSIPTSIILQKTVSVDDRNGEEGINAGIS